MKNLSPEITEKAKNAKDAQELIALAKENGIELAEEDARLYFEIKDSGEIPDDLLGAVSGGAVYTPRGGYLIVTNFHECDRWICDECGGTSFRYMRIQDGMNWVHKCGGHPNGCGKSCATCKYMKYRFPFQICIHPETKK